MDLAQHATAAAPYAWTQGVWSLTQGHRETAGELPFHVVAYDFGISAISCACW